MIDISISRDDDDVTGIPAKGFHFDPRGRLLLRDTKALRPVFPIGKKIRCTMHRMDFDWDDERREVDYLGLDPRITH